MHKTGDKIKWLVVEEQMRKANQAYTQPLHSATKEVYQLLVPEVQLKDFEKRKLAELKPKNDIHTYTN
jgi:hypothetical protein